MNEASRPARRPAEITTAELSRRYGQRWWDKPGAVSDDDLMRVVRAMNAVDRAVDGYRGKQWAA